MPKFKHKLFLKDTVQRAIADRGIIIDTKPRFRSLAEKFAGEKVFVFEKGVPVGKELQLIKQFKAAKQPKPLEFGIKPTFEQQRQLTRLQKGLDLIVFKEGRIKIIEKKPRFKKKPSGITFDIKPRALRDLGFKTRQQQLRLEKGLDLIQFEKGVAKIMEAPKPKLKPKPLEFDIKPKVIKDIAWGLKQQQLRRKGEVGIFRKGDFEFIEKKPRFKKKFKPFRFKITEEALYPLRQKKARLLSRADIVKIEKGVTKIVEAPRQRQQLLLKPEFKKPETKIFTIAPASLSELGKRAIGKVRDKKIRQRQLQLLKPEQKFKVKQIQIQYQRQFQKQLQLEKQRIKQLTIQQQRQRQVLAAPLRLGEREKQIQRQLQKQKLVFKQPQVLKQPQKLGFGLISPKAIQKLRFEEKQRLITELLTKTKVPRGRGLLLPFPLGYKRTKRPIKLKKVKPVTRYTPSLVGSILQLKVTKKPYVIPGRPSLGFLPGVRGILVKKKKRKS